MLIAFQTEPLTEFLIAVVIFMGGVIVAMAGAWVTSAKNAATRDELRDAVTQSLGLVQNELVTANRHYETLRDNVSEHDRQITAIETELQMRKANGEYRRGHSAGG